MSFHPYLGHWQKPNWVGPAEPRRPYGKRMPELHRERPPFPPYTPDWEGKPKVVKWNPYIPRKYKKPTDLFPTEIWWRIQHFILWWDPNTGMSDWSEAFFGRQIIWRPLGRPRHKDKFGNLWYRGQGPGSFIFHAPTGDGYQLNRYYLDRYYGSQDYRINPWAND